MPNRFSPSVLPRERPGFFGILESAAEGVENFVNSREFVRKRDRTEATEDLRNEVLQKEDRRAQETHDRNRLVSDISLALQGFEPGQEATATRGESALPDRPGTMRESIGGPSAAVPDFVPVFNPAAGQEVGGGGFTPIDERILASNGGRLPGDVRPALGMPAERLPIPGGSIENPEFKSLADQRRLMAALAPIVGPEMARAITVGGVETPGFDDFKPQDAPRTIEGVVADRLHHGESIDPGVFGAAEELRDASKFRPVASTGGATNARNAANIEMVALVQGDPENGVEPMDPTDAARFVAEKHGVAPDMNAVGDILDDMGRDPRRVESRFGAPSDQFQAAALEAVKTFGLESLPEARDIAFEMIDETIEGEAERAAAKEAFTNWMEQATEPPSISDIFTSRIRRSIVP